VLREKYLFHPTEAELVASFLNPMLRLEPDRRASAREMLEHPILEGIEVQGERDVRERAERHWKATAGQEGALKPVPVQTPPVPTGGGGGGGWDGGVPVLSLPQPARGAAA
jgi:hypothetical protein